MDNLMDVISHIFHTFGVYFFIFLVMAYGLGWSYLIGNDRVDASSVVDVLRPVPYSLLYLIRDVLPFWWSAGLLAALALASRNSDDVKHIMESHHQWGKIMANPSWPKVKAVIGETLEKGVPQSYKSVNSKVLSYRGGKVQVTYVKLPNGQTRISDAWVQNSSRNPIK
jgi:hypothetical protein